MATSNDAQLMQFMSHILKTQRKDIVVPDVPNEPEHPVTVVTTVKEIKDQIQKAITNKTIVRVVGSKHSVEKSIFNFPSHGITLKLEGGLRTVTKQEVTVDPETKKKFLKVRVGAGCNIGVDPDDHTSDIENSLAHQINSQGFALPITGGIIYQTVGGFLATGSAGGSLKHGLAECIDDLEFIDGTGTEQTAKRGTDEWSAVGVSMGLYGVITYVTLLLPETFFVSGTQITKPFDKSDIDPKSIVNTLKTQEYFRANWFPQKGVSKAQQWAAKQVPVDEKPIPYVDPMGCELMAAGAGLVLWFTSTLLQKEKVSHNDLVIQETLLDLFLNGKETEFKDYWYKILPQDNSVPTDSIFPIQFTEIWLPVEEASEVIKKLEEMFKDPKAAGNFATEIYGAKKSPFWLSMSHDQDCIRVDAYWFKYNVGNLRTFYDHFWKTLLSSKSRLHWGKFMPTPGQKVNDQVTYNLAYLKTVYKKLDDWLTLRKKYDPHNIFLNDYWKGYFEIK